MEKSALCIYFHLYVKSAVYRLCVNTINLPIDRNVIEAVCFLSLYLLFVCLHSPSIFFFSLLLLSADYYVLFSFLLFHVGEHIWTLFGFVE